MNIVIKKASANAKKKIREKGCKKDSIEAIDILISEYFKEKRAEIKRELNPIRAIDEGNLKIAEASGLLEKVVQIIRDKFGIPTLTQGEDEHSKVIFYGGEDRQDDIELLSSKWKESLPEKQQEIFQNNILNALKKMNLSLALYKWLEKYVLYGEKEPIDEFTYYEGKWDLVEAVYSRHSLTTGEKKSIKRFLKNVSQLKHFKNKITKKVFREFLERLKTAPPKKERRKPMINIAIEAIKKHGKTEKYLTSGDEVGRDWEKLKWTDERLAASLFDEDDTFRGAERIKKLRQRLKPKLKK